MAQPLSCLKAATDGSLAVVIRGRPLLASPTTNGSFQAVGRAAPRSNRPTASGNLEQRQWVDFGPSAAATADVRAHFDVIKRRVSGFELTAAGHVI